ncbi:MAG: DUF364 domain-containing protein [Anaerolineae bacterium]
MSLLDDLIETLPDSAVRDVRIGLHWTAVVAETVGGLRCGLCATLREEESHGVPAVARAGALAELSGRELAALARSERLTERSVGVAAINALVAQPPLPAVEINAEEVILAAGAGRTVALVGHFPFVPRLRESVGRLHVLELNPREGDLPASAAPQVIPAADVVAITGMTLANHTLENLLALCAPGAMVLVLGPSTPLSSLLFARGVDLLAGSVVTDIEGVLRAVSQGANFRQVHRAGVRLVTITRPGWGSPIL